MNILFIYIKETRPFLQVIFILFLKVKMICALYKMKQIILLSLLKIQSMMYVHWVPQDLI